MNEIKLQTFSEIYCLLNFFPKEYIEKLPKKLLNIPFEPVFNFCEK